MNFETELDAYMTTASATPRSNSLLKGFGTAAVAGTALFGAADASAAIVSFTNTGVNLLPGLVQGMAFYGGIFPIANIQPFVATATVGGGTPAFTGGIQMIYADTIGFTNRFRLAGFSQSIIDNESAAGLQGPSSMLLGGTFMFMTVYTGWWAFATGLTSMGDAITGTPQLLAGMGVLSFTVLPLNAFRIFAAIENVAGAGVTVGSFISLAGAGGGGGGAVPEPGTAALAILALGAVGVSAMRRRKEQAA